MARALRLVSTLGLALLAAPVVMAASTELPPEVVEAYYECMERHDLDAIQDLLWYHHNIEPIDATIYGLPKDDFDDRSLLTIEERLEFRQGRAEAGLEMATSGDVQYPHSLRLALDHFYEKSGRRPDCSEILQAAGGAAGEPEVVGSGWGSELVLTQADSYERGEPHVAVDHADPRRLIVTVVPSGGGTEDSDYVASTGDWGQTWWFGQVGLNAGSQFDCDPASYYQRSTGTVYHAKLSWISGTQTKVFMRYSEDNGERWNDCASTPGNQALEDREWMVVDNTPLWDSDGDGVEDSPNACYGDIYVSYNASNAAKVVRSMDGCVTFTDRTTLTSTGNAIGPDLATGPDGHVFVAWHNYGSEGQALKLAGSNDCGVTWTSPAVTSVKPRYGSHINNLPAVCVRGISPQPMIDVDVSPRSQFYGRLYYAMLDMSAAGCATQGGWSCSTWDSNWNNPCNFDVFLAYSDDDGQTWSTPVNLTAGDGNLVDHFLGYMRVDAADGSLWLGYHRTRLNPTTLQDRQRTHFFVTRSTDGGATWETPFQASDSEGNERAAGANTFELGDYNSLDVHEGVAWPAWITRAQVTPLEEDVLTRKICSEPAHWSERAPTFTAPATRTAAGSTAVTVTWDAPDVFWGDAGEDPASRKYQLWVDGVLTLDNIPWTATSTSYAPGDTSSHSYFIRAVNQCGLSKDYSADSAALCPSNPDSVDVIPDGALTVCIVSGQLLTATPSPAGSYSYRWYEDGTVVGGSSSTYTANNVGTHLYTAEASHASCVDWVPEPLPTTITWQQEPVFGGIQSVASAANPDCGLALGWDPATATCGGPVTYDVYRGESPDFTPGAGNLVASNLTSTSYTDFSELYQGTEYSYVVRATDDGVAAGESNLVVLSGVPQGDAGTAVLVDDFEGGNIGWVFEKGTPPATSGDFVIGDPVGTTGAYGWPIQPGDDHTLEPGVNCLYSAENPSGNVDTNDIDSGEVMTTSPVFDSFGYGSLVLELWRWFANEDAGDEGDYYTLEVSNDGGGSWVELESLGGNVTNANLWTYVRFNLEDYVTPTSNMQIRARAADGAGGGDDYVEMALDDVAVTGYAYCSSDVCPPLSCDAVVVDVDPVCGVGTQQQFTVNYSGGDGPIAVEWDLDDDGLYDDCFGNPCSTALPAGVSTVRARITDSCQTGAQTCTASTTATVEEEVAAPPAPRATDRNACAQTGLYVNWDAVAGATAYDLRFDGATVISNASSPYLYNPGDYGAHTCELRGKNATCGEGAWSPATAFRDGTPTTEILFCDRFETGNTDGWDETVW